MSVSDLMSLGQRLAQQHSIKELQSMLKTEKCGEKKFAIAWALEERLLP